MSNIAKRDSQADGHKFLRDAFERVHARLAFDLRDAAKTVTHDGKRGEVTESDWLRVIRNYLPNRYAADSAIVIDSTGTTSDQIDIVIYDPHYTPALLTREPNRYIPSEAVYAVLEAKPTINKSQMEYAGKKAYSVRRLRRTSAPVVYSDGVHAPKKLFPILAGIVAAEVGWKDGFGKPFQKILSGNALAGDHRIDCGCGLSHGAFDAYDGALILGEKKSGLAFFLFRLLNKLQSLGTVPAIDWNVYSKVLRSGK